jgi:Glycine rich protein family
MHDFYLYAGEIRALIIYFCTFLTQLAIVLALAVFAAAATVPETADQSSESKTVEKRGIIGGYGGYPYGGYGGYGGLYGGGYGGYGGYGRGIYGGYPYGGIGGGYHGGFGYPRFGGFGGFY